MERLEKLQKAYEARPDQAEQGVAVAAHYRSGELYDLANRVLGSILDQDPNCEAARREQARVWRQSGDLQIAAQLYEELIEAYPDDLLLRDEYLDAKIAYGEARWAETGKDRQVWNDLQKMRLEREKNRMAYLRQFLRERPEAFEERAEMGELLIRHGQIEEAIPYVQRLVHELPFAAKGYFLLGQCFLAKGDQALAIVQYEKSIEYFKNRGYSHIPSEDLKTVYYHLGIAKENCGDVTGAREAYGMVYAADIHFKDIRERYEKTFR
jgi:tetratricopeptide (TPR) repeat protein